MRKHLAGFVAVLVVALVSGITGCGGGGTGGGPSERPPTFVLNAAGTSSNSGTLVLGLDRSSIDANNSDTVGVVATLDTYTLRVEAVKRSPSLPGDTGEARFHLKC